MWLDITRSWSHLSGLLTCLRPARSVRFRAQRCRRRRRRRWRHLAGPRSPLSPPRRRPSSSLSSSFSSPLSPCCGREALSRWSVSSWRAAGWRWHGACQRGARPLTTCRTGAAGRVAPGSAGGRAACPGGVGQPTAAGAASADTAAVAAWRTACRTAGVACASWEAGEGEGGWVGKRGGDLQQTAQQGEHKQHNTILYLKNKKLLFAWPFVHLLQNICTHKGVQNNQYLHTKCIVKAFLKASWTMYNHVVFFTVLMYCVIHLKRSDTCWQRHPDTSANSTRMQILWKMSTSYHQVHQEASSSLVLCCRVELSPGCTFSPR